MQIGICEDENDKSKSAELYRRAYLLLRIHFQGLGVFSWFALFWRWSYFIHPLVGSLQKSAQHESIGSGGYSDPDDQEWMYAETWLHEDGFEEKSLVDIKTYILEQREQGLILGNKYISHDLVPSFYLAD